MKAISVMVRVQHERTLETGGGSWAGEHSWTITACDGTELASGGDPFAGCIELGDNYNISLVDSYGDGWDGASMTIGDGYTVSSGATLPLQIAGACE